MIGDKARASGFPAEVTFVRGVPILQPEGTSFLIRARFHEAFSGEEIPFPATVCVSGQARRAEAIDDRTPIGVSPREGEPQSLVGTVIAVLDAGAFRLACPFPVEIRLPVEIQSRDNPPPKVGSRMKIELAHGLEVTQVDRVGVRTA